MDSRLVEINKEQPQVTILTINRPDKRNALNSALLQQLTKAVDNASQDPINRVLILRANGDVFCSGMDLAEAVNQKNVESTTTLVMKMLKAIYTSPLVTIAAVHGPAMAAGAGITAACDFVIATEESKLGFPEASRGLVPAIVMCYLIRQVPYRIVREMLLFGEAYTADRAFSRGLINKVVISEGELNREALKLARRVLNQAPDAIIKTKKLLDEIYPGKLDEDIKKALACLQNSLNSEEAQEGIKAFLEKRDPVWT